jgi:hypothetical protein
MKMAGRHFLQTGLLCAMSAACTHETPPPIHEVRNYNATFTCDGSQQVQVRFVPFRAMLESQGVSFDMTQQPAADGYLYAGGGQSLRGRGYEATWTDSGGAIHHCQDVVAKGPKTNTASH